LVDGESTPYRTNTFYADGGYKAGLPWLFYLNGGSSKKASTVLQPKPTRVKFHASFTTTNRKYGILSRLQFKLASYDIDGNFLGFSDLAEQLFLCPVSPAELEKFTSIGRVSRSKCSFDLKKLTEPSLYP
jgi:hypothetical protein|tara:strand:+ start:577 stop:966 length:390 start_codon:yes stop_codon:yes gene_type:complete